MTDTFDAAGYAERIRQRRLEQKKNREVQPRPSTLAEKIAEWESTLSLEQKRQGISMKTLTQMFGGSAGQIGSIMHGRSWRRRRIWSLNRSHCRYWYYDGS